ncbi:MAG TPA: class F sortase [Lapillicoccus sp.]|nr:class F sortase [Lapillicoccus sp.]
MSRFPWAKTVAVVAAVMVGGALTAVAVWPRETPSADAVASRLELAPTPSVTASTATPVEPESSLPSLRVATTSPAAAAEPPTRVVVARLGIDMPVEPQGVLPDGEMALPASPSVAGWYRFGSAPDDPAGATVLAAHVDSKTGIGPFVRLGSARAGDTVEVFVGSERHAYRVTEVVRVDKQRVDPDELFAVSGPRRLHLVTCTGDYVTGSGYTQNLVVIADRE